MQKMLTIWEFNWKSYSGPWHVLLTDRQAHKDTSKSISVPSPWAADSNGNYRDSFYGWKQETRDSIQKSHNEKLQLKCLWVAGNVKIQK